MKKTLLSLSLITLALAGKAQTCSDLIISEYVEGTSNNKALEFYNASPTAISLANYRVIRWDNGSVSADQSPEGVMQLPTNIMLGAYQTYVIALNLTDPNGTGQSAPIDVALQAKADTLMCPGCATGTGNSRVMCFNGNDALSLQKNISGTWTNIDIFGKIGEDPGSSWSDQTPFTDAQGAWWTINQTLLRKSSVQAGVTTNPSLFNVTVQWDSLPVNTYAQLGIHYCSCNPNSVKEMSKSFAFSVFPNPAKNTIKIESSSLITKISIINVVGQELKSVKSDKNISGNTIDISGLAQGIYSIIVYDDKNNVSVDKLIKD